MIDSFREIYIPQQIIEGSALYKDIFTIYPPLAYLINAFILFLFKSNFHSLIFFGLIITGGITHLTYYLAKNFTSENFAFSACLFTISGVVLSPNVFNTFLPYSYGILYGVFFMLLAAFGATKKNFPLMYMFYSLAILSKYEFLLVLPLLFFVSRKKDCLKNILFFLAPIFLVSSILFIQGTRFEDIFATLNWLNIMSGTKTLYWFYSAMGLVFRVELIPIYIINFLKFIIPIATYEILKFINSKLKIQNKYYKAGIYLIITLPLIIMCANRVNEIILYTFPLLLILFIFKIRSLNKEEIFFVIFTLLMSIKVFFALSLSSYGAYFLPFALITLGILTPSKLKKPLMISLIIWGLIWGITSIQNLADKNSYKALTPVTDYIKENTDPTDIVVTYPECLAINVLSNRKSDNKFYSLIPLYVETFSEELIIKRLEIIKPNFFILNDYDTSLYYYKEFGKDYATIITKWIEENYSLRKIINTNLEFKIYEIKTP